MAHSQIATVGNAIQRGRSMKERALGYSADHIYLPIAHGRSCLVLGAITTKWPADAGPRVPSALGSPCSEARPRDPHSSAVIRPSVSHQASRRTSAEF